MALGEQFPVIRIEVDQRLTLETGADGQLQDDASVATEITYFDRVGNFYILEGVLTFSGSVAAATGDSESGSQHRVSPISCRLPFALRIPVKGQPNFLDVNTRIGEWGVKPAGPGQLQLLAELLIQGLNGQNGYSFYCGDQEVSVPPQYATSEAAVQEADAAAAGHGSARSGMQPQQQADKGYNEREWMIEAKEKQDEPDSLVFQPDSGWLEQLQSALQQPAAAVRSGEQPADDSQPVDRPPADGEQLGNEERLVDRAASESEPTVAPVREEEVYQFEALADELSVEEDTPLSAEAAWAGCAAEAAESAAEPATASAEGEATGAAAPEVEAAAAEPVASEQMAGPAVEQVAAPVEPAPAGPKISFGAKKEEVNGAPVKLSGLAYGSVTKEMGREEPAQAGAAEQANVQPTAQAVAKQTVTQETAVKAAAPQAGGAEAAVKEGAAEEAVEQVAEIQRDEDDAAASVVYDTAAEESATSLWGKWLQKESDEKYTLKFRIVQESESLDELANRYGTPVESLMRANGLTSEQIDAGQVLIIPGRRR
ncbi:LysM peptidoglycan-binding domain-containing protein [Effusibacillus pohliae]|uniref:LysM peptidoglycan-binding domain-containing protein n=1 Tax=Effusibacillus pohliae TaxID=232270 RepID=UPI00037FD4B1|nr:LysM peptidoglycan-binding domain-containing protein [Effusibacillus pohliae]